MIVPKPALSLPRIVRVLEHPIVREAVPILVTSVAVYVLHKFASQVHWADVKADIAGSSKKALGFALLWTVISFFALSFYDVLAMRSVAKGRFPDKIAGLAGASGIAISNLLGFSYLTGTAVCYRVYAALGLDLALVAGAIATSWIALLMGLILILGALMTLHPKGLSTVLPLANTTETVLGVGLILALTALFVWLARCPRRLSLAGFGFDLPGFRLSGGLTMAALFDLTGAAMTLYALMPADLVQSYVTATVAVWGVDPRIADEKLRLAEKVIQGRYFTCIIETTNAVEAWLGSLPDHVYANIRQPPVSTLNLAHMIPLSAVWAGTEQDDHFAAPPVLFGQTEGSTPFRLSLHVGDVGHTLVVGPTGAGTSVLLALMALQFRRYARGQIFALNFGGSIRAAALVMGGDWYDLGGALSDDASEPVALQPLAHIHEAATRNWAADWIANILSREGVMITPDVKDHLWSALSSLASAKIGERTLTGLSVMLQSQDLKRALQPYCIEGPFGHLLDAEEERLGTATVQAFETGGPIRTGAAPAVLAYLFHRIEARLDGSPTLLIIDEGWLALDDTGFSAQLREWLKPCAKKNASVVFATESLADIDGSSIAPAIIESCPTRLFLPNERALEPQIAEL
jgi:uncharacterized membrane protein YbhN (UPF0104 family)